MINTPYEPNEEEHLGAIQQALQIYEKDSDEGEQRLIVLAEKGSVFSMVRLGHICWSRAVDAGNSDFGQAERWFLSAYNAGSPIATFFLGRLYLREQEYIKARTAFEAGTNLNYAPSIFHLGRIYRDGLDVERRYDLARSLFERATALDHIYAKRALGRLLLSGRCGFLSRFKGLILIVQAGLEATKQIQKDPESERLRM